MAGTLHRAALHSYAASLWRAKPPPHKNKPDYEPHGTDTADSCGLKTVHAGMEKQSLLIIRSSSIKKKRHGM